MHDFQECEADFPPERQNPDSRRKTLKRIGPPRFARAVRK
jgi:hypothetical protein